MHGLRSRLQVGSGRQAVLAFVSLAVMGALVPVGASFGEDPDYRLVVACPFSLTPSVNSLPTCPVRASDNNLGFLLGSPSLAVDAKNPQHLILHALHGGDANGPTTRSRSPRPFTTFISTDQGGSWLDKSFVEPREIQGAFGEQPQVVNDPYGRLFVGSLYSRPQSDGPPGQGPGPDSFYEYVIVAQKFRNVQDASINQDGEHAAQYLDPYVEGYRITQFWYVYDPDSEIMTILWHERPQSARADGASPLAAAPASAPRGGGLIAMASTTFNDDDYEYAPASSLIGPCVSSTNPVVSGGNIYVGCVADPDAAPFVQDPSTGKGRLHLFRLPADQSAEPTYLGATPLVAESARLGVRSDGRLAIFTAAVRDERSVLIGAFGREVGGRVAWDGLVDLGSKVPVLRPDERVIDAKIQDLVYREYSGAVHAILKQHVRHDALIDPSRPLEAAKPPAFRKWIVAFDEEHGWLGAHNFDVGNPANMTDDPAKRQQRDLFWDDISDDILQMPPQPYSYGGKDLGTYPREFVAIGDYGDVQFAEVVELTPLRWMGVPPAPAPVAALAAPSASLSVAGIVVPVVGLTMAGLFVAALFASRRKNSVAAFAKQK